MHLQLTSQTRFMMNALRRHSVDSPEAKIKDEGTLADLGYKQELQREWHVLQNFGVSFSIISVIGMLHRHALWDR